MLASAYGIGCPEISAAPRWPVVLYFHHVCPKASHYTEITPSKLARMLDLMLERFEPLEPELVEQFDVVEVTKKPRFLLTFDDGYLDNWEFALPVLERQRVKAVFFVVTGQVGMSITESPRMSWDHLRELARRGHRIGSHTVTHRPLTELSSMEAVREIASSLAAVSLNTRRQASLFAYPFGKVRSDLSAGLGNWTGFGTVRTQPLPWVQARRCIRRTYLPSSRPEVWPQLIDSWRAQWNEELAS